jgi:hypothetical protein
MAQLMERGFSTSWYAHSPNRINIIKIIAEPKREPIDQWIHNFSHCLHQLKVLRYISLRFTAKSSLKGKITVRSSFTFQALCKSTEVKSFSRVLYLEPNPTDSVSLELHTLTCNVQPGGILF